MRRHTLKPISVTAPTPNYLTKIDKQAKLNDLADELMYTADLMYFAYRSANPHILSREDGETSTASFQQWLVSREGKEYSHIISVVSNNLYNKLENLRQVEEFKLLVIGGHPPPTTTHNNEAKRSPSHTLQRQSTGALSHGLVNPPRYGLIALIRPGLEKNNYEAIRKSIKKSVITFLRKQRDEFHQFIQDCLDTLDKPTYSFKKYLSQQYLQASFPDSQADESQSQERPSTPLLPETIARQETEAMSTTEEKKMELCDTEPLLERGLRYLKRLEKLDGIKEWQFSATSLRNIETTKYFSLSIQFYSLFWQLRTKDHHVWSAYDEALTDVVDWLEAQGLKTDTETSSNYLALTISGFTTAIIDKIKAKVLKAQREVKNQYQSSHSSSTTAADNASISTTTMTGMFRKRKAPGRSQEEKRSDLPPGKRTKRPGATDTTSTSQSATSPANTR